LPERCPRSGVRRSSRRVSRCHGDVARHYIRNRDAGWSPERPPASAASRRHEDDARHVAGAPDRGGIRGRDAADRLDVRERDAVKLSQTAPQHAVHVDRRVGIGVLDRLGAVLPEPVRPQPGDGVVGIAVAGGLQLGAGDVAGAGMERRGAWSVRAARRYHDRQEWPQDPNGEVGSHGSHGGCSTTPICSLALPPSTTTGRPPIDLRAGGEGPRVSASPT